MIAFASVSCNAISTSLSPSGTQPHFLIKGMSLSRKREIAVNFAWQRVLEFEARTAAIMGYGHSKLPVET
jgi:hypothetical protein